MKYKMIILMPSSLLLLMPTTGGFDGVLFLVRRTLMVSEVEMQEILKGYTEVSGLHVSLKALTGKHRSLE